MTFVFPSTLYLSPSLLTLNTPFQLYLSTSGNLAEFYLYSSPFMPCKILRSMTNVDKSDGSLHAFECRKMKKGSVI